MATIHTIAAEDRTVLLSKVGNRRQKRFFHYDGTPKPAKRHKASSRQVVGRLAAVSGGAPSSVAEAVSAVPESVVSEAIPEAAPEVRKPRRFGR
jgi:hypothetical protein